MRAETGAELVALLGTSFSGGICGYYTTQHPSELTSLVMLNPLLDYKKRFIDDKPYWHDDQINEESGRELAGQGFLAHSPTFKLGRPLLNEVFYLRPHTMLGDIQVPTLIVHGTEDTSSRWNRPAGRPSNLQLSTSSSKSTVPSTASPSTTIQAMPIRRASDGRPRSSAL